MTRARAMLLSGMTIVVLMLQVQGVACRSVRAQVGSSLKKRSMVSDHRSSIHGSMRRPPGCRPHSARPGRSCSPIGQSRPVRRSPLQVASPSLPGH